MYVGLVDRFAGTSPWMDEVDPVRNIGPSKTSHAKHARGAGYREKVRLEVEKLAWAM